MKYSVKLLLWTLLMVLVAAIIYAAMWGYKRITAVDDTVAEEQIGSTLKQAIAQLAAAPPVPALGRITDADDVPELANAYIERLKRMRSGDIADLRRELPRAILRYESGVRSENEALRLMTVVHGAYASALPALDKWVAEEPDSYAALITRGAVRSAIGWHWRGSDYIPYTPKENLAEMTRWHQLAVDDFVRALSKSRYPVFAVERLISISVAHGWQQESKKLYLAGERLSPSSDALYSAYERAVYGEWGTGSAPAAKAFLKHAEDNGVSFKVRSSLMRGLINFDSGNKYSIGEPDALPYAVVFTEKYDIGWWRRAEVEQSEGLYEAALKSLRRAAEDSPASAELMQDITYVLNKLEREDDVKLALRRAADLGSDWAQDQIIANMIWERHGEKRDWAKIKQECEASAEILNPAGQNCVGGLYFDGLAGYPKDHAKAISYFELAARQGNERAQHDYGWMLIQGMGITEDRKKGLFFMRNSARKKFPPALDKLKQLGERTDNLEWQANWWESKSRDIKRLLDRGVEWKQHY